MTAAAVRLHFTVWSDRKVRPDPHNTQEQLQLFEDPLELLRAVLRRVGAVSEYVMRVGVTSSLLLSHPPQHSAFVIDQLVRGAVLGETNASAALLALATVLLSRSDENYDMFRAIYEAAAAEDRDCVTYLFLDLPPHHILENRKSLRGPRFERDVSLGERKQMARTSDRHLLERLLLDLNPEVIRKLCMNPKVTLKDILQVCTRRPNTPEAITAIAMSHRWFVREEVRFAILSNPYSPTGISLKLLPLLKVQQLKEISSGVDLHPAIMHTAKRLLDLRRISLGQGLSG